MQPLNALVPMVHVKNLPRSIAFYGRLGFAVKNTLQPEGRTEPVWAWLSSGEAQLMLALADEPVVPSEQAVLFYVYCEDVASCRAMFAENGVAVGEIQFPFYAPRGEFRVSDPDGFAIMVTHT